MQLGGVAAAAVLAVVVSVAANGALAEAGGDGHGAPLRIVADRTAPATESAVSDKPLSIVPDGAFAAAQREQARLLLFATADLWRHGGFGYGGLLWSPAGLDNEGLTLKLLFGGGLYRYLSGALGDAEVLGRQLSAAVLPGWRLIRNGFILTLFAGPEFQSHRLSPDDVSAGLRGNYFGLRAGFDVWCEPSPSTMIAADASVSTVGPSYSVRLAGGWRIFERFYLGPELQAFAADDNYRQFRAGIHITALRTGAYEWTAGFGWAGDSDERNSAYGKIGVHTRR
jgi:hypothetical protein